MIHVTVGKIIHRKHYGYFTSKNKTLTMKRQNILPNNYSFN